jgi:site-specific recombinase XerD
MVPWREIYRSQDNLLSIHDFNLVLEGEKAQKKRKYEGDSMKRFPVRHCVYIGDPADNYIRYRRIIPEKLRPQLDGRTEWSHTFAKGTSLGEIERHAKALAAQHKALLLRAKVGETISTAMIAQAEADAGVFLAGDAAARYEWQSFLANEAKSLPPSAPFALQLNALEHGGKFVPDMLTLTAANERRSKAPNPRDVANAIKAFVAVVGEKDIRAIRRSDVRRFIAHELARDVKPSSVRRRCVTLQGIITDTFDDMEIAQANPFARLKIEGSAPSVEDRDCFDREQLAKVDSYVAASKRLGPETRNVLTLLKLTGAMPIEIAGLTIGDVKLDHAVPHIVVTENQTRGLKTPHRKRKVPLIGDALTAAQDGVRRALTRSKGKRGAGGAGDARLFTRGFGANGRKADNISANLNALIDRAGVDSKKLTVYSYRHTVKEAMVTAGVEEHLRRQLLGHSPRDSHERYGAKQRPLTELRDALASALECLGDVEKQETEKDEAA